MPRSILVVLVSCFILPLAVLIPSTTGCTLTAADKQIASAVLSGVPPAAPVACAIVSASGGDGTACSKDTAAASAVAQMVQQILAGFPTSGMRKGETLPDAGAPAAPSAPEPMVAFKIHRGETDVDVTLPASVAAYVQTHLPAGASL